MVGYGLVSELSLALREPVPGAFIFHGEDAPDGAPAPGEGAWQPLGPGHGHGFSSEGGDVELSIRFGPELSFGRALVDAGARPGVAIVKYARNGSAIDPAAAGANGSWDPDAAGTSQLDHARAAIARALEASDVDGDGRDDRLRPAGIVWMQGESDAAHDQAIALRYATSLAQVVAALRDALGAPDLPAVIGRISDSRAGQERPIWPHGAIVRAAQAAYTDGDPCATLVTETDGYRYSDRFHYDSAGYLDLGQRFARTMLESPCYRARAP